MEESGVKYRLCELSKKGKGSAKVSERNIDT